MTPDARLAEIGDRIARRLRQFNVQVDGGRTWRVSRTDLSAPPGVRRPREELAGVDIYQGRTGIAWAVLEFAHVTNNADLRDFAIETIRSALRLPMGSAMPASLYSGGLGLGWAAARVFKLTGDGEFRTAARRAVEMARPAVLHEGGLDVIAGSAGAVLGALDIWRWTDDPSALELALRAGAVIRERARVRHSGWSWRTMIGTCRHDVCGFGHGAGGFVMAALELYAATADRAWAHFAERGLQYERKHYQAGTGDWLDLRDNYLADVKRAPNGLEQLVTDIAAGRVPADESTSMRAWCHGSPGNVVVRRRALSLALPLEHLRAEEQAATASTRRSMTGEDGEPSRGFSLCHGVAGNGECLITGAGASANSDRQFFVDRLLAAGDAYEFAGKPWPSGALHHVPDPSLMLGDAGVLLAIVRLLSPSVPSVLFPGSGTGNAWSCDEPRSPSRGDVATGFPVAAAEREVRSVAPLAMRVLDRLSGADWSRDSLRGAPGAHAALRRLVDASRAKSWHLQFADALTPELACLELEEQVVDHAPGIRAELASQFGSADLADDTVVIRNRSSTIIETRWSWREWSLDRALPDERTEYSIVLARRGAMVLEPLGPLAASLLRHAGDAIPLRDLLARASQSMDVTGRASDGIVSASRRMALELQRQGYLVTSTAA